MSELQQYYDNFKTGYWATQDPEHCPCRGGGWALSEVDTWHECPIHYKNQPHPEDWEYREENPMSEWLQEPYEPQEVSQVDLAFPAMVKRLMPDWDAIPSEFKNYNLTNKWIKMAEDWFYKGMKNIVRKPKSEDFNEEMAIRHLGCIMASYEPKHQHKMSAIAYLASLWFDDIQYETATP